MICISTQQWFSLQTLTFEGKYHTESEFLGGLFTLLGALSMTNVAQAKVN